MSAECLRELYEDRARLHCRALELIRSGYSPKSDEVRALDGEAYALDAPIERLAGPIATRRREITAGRRKPDPSTRSAGESLAWLVLDSLTQARKFGIPLPEVFTSHRPARPDALLEACEELRRIAEGRRIEEREIRELARRDEVAA